MIFRVGRVLDAINHSNRYESAGGDLAEYLLLALEKSTTVDDWLSRVVPFFCRELHVDLIGLVQQSHGRWVMQAWNQETVVIADRLFPENLVAKSLDEGNATMEAGWFVLPISLKSNLGAKSATGEEQADQCFVGASALVFHTADAQWHQQVEQVRRVEDAARCLSLAWVQQVRTEQATQRTTQLSAVLEAAAQWQRHEEDQSLLEAIASSATEILNCERASIFLWDRKRKKLVGRPALGVPGGVLEVDDSVGVVGEVLQSESPRIWNHDRDEESRVNRKVDQTLEFETHSLVAVPMFDQKNRLIGVFEAINHTDSVFGQSHVSVLGDLAKHAAVAIQSQRVQNALAATRDRLVSDAAASSPLIGSHPSILALKETAKKVAGTDLGVLIRGGNGTGKEVLARAIHFESNRRAGPFIAVNCAALVETLLESELFGHEKGSFTDAQATRVGKFELADQGTLFLDEVGDMSPGGQAKLLRVLEEKVVVRVGGSQTIPVDVRVIAATNQPLEELIQKKLFREDLFFRLNVVHLTLPELTDRGDDVLVLAEHFLDQFCSQIGRSVPVFLPAARRALLSYAWPGNIRELRNTIERVAYLCTSDQIDVDDLMISPSTLEHLSRPVVMGGTLNEATREFQVAHIRRAIDECDGSMTEAAKLLGLHRSNLYRKMNQLGMESAEEE